MRTIGVDVSHWEGQIDWQLASCFVPWCYLKCTDGIGGVDVTYEPNRAGLERYGVAHAPYHFYQPGQDPAAQADHFIKVAGTGYQVYVVDVEEDNGADESLPSSLLSFLLRCRQLTGQQPAIYTSAGYWNEFIRPKPAWAPNYQLLVAHYTAEHLPILPIGWQTWTAWQFSDCFYFPGCSSPADGDWFNGDLSQARAWLGNYRQVEPVIYSLRARSYFDQLHVRNGPNTASKELGHLNRGDVINIEELGGGDVWVHHSRGWTCVEQAGYRYMEVLK